MDILISPYAHQDALNDVARQVLPEGLEIQGHGSVYQESKHIYFQVSGKTTPSLLKDAQARFRELTSWHLSLSGCTFECFTPSSSVLELAAKRMVLSSWSCRRRNSVPLRELSCLLGFVKVDAYERTHSLVASFLFSWMPCALYVYKALARASRYDRLVHQTGAYHGSRCPD